MLGMDVMSQVAEFTSDIDFSTMFSELVNWATTMFGDAFLILIYVLFLLIEESIFHHKMAAISSSEEQMEKTTKLLSSQGHYTAWQHGTLLFAILRA